MSLFTLALVSPFLQLITALSSVLISSLLIGHADLSLHPIPWIERLPPELLLDIVHLVTRPYRRHRLPPFPTHRSPTCLYYRRLCTLIHVCRTWSQIIAAAPSLWDHLHTAFGPLETRRIIERSQFAPLTVIYDLDSIPDQVNAEAVPSARRWRDVRILLLESPTPEVAVFSADCISLRRLDIAYLGCNLGGKRYYSNTPMFAGKQSSPREIELYNIAIPLTSLNLDSLSSLTLTRTTFTLAEVSRILRYTSPTLTQFILDTWPHAQPAGEPQPPSTPVILPRLRMLDIRLKASQARWLLLQLHPPILHSFACLLRSGQLDAVEDLARWAGPAAERFGGTRTLEVRIQPGLMDIAGPFKFSVRTTDPLSSYRAVIRCLSPSILASVTQLLWTTSSIVGVVEDLQTLFASCPSIHTVDVQTCATGLRDVMQVACALDRIICIRVWSSRHIDTLQGAPRGWDVVRSIDVSSETPALRMNSPGWSGECECLGVP